MTESWNDKFYRLGVAVLVAAFFKGESPQAHARWVRAESKLAAHKDERLKALRKGNKMAYPTVGKPDYTGRIVAATRSVNGGINVYYEGTEIGDRLKREDEERIASLQEENAMLTNWLSK